MGSVALQSGQKTSWSVWNRFMHTLTGSCLVSRSWLTVRLSAHKSPFQKLVASYGQWLVLHINCSSTTLLSGSVHPEQEWKRNAPSLPPPYSCNKRSVPDFSRSFTALAVLTNAEVPCFMHAVLLWGRWLNSSKVHKETFHSYSQRQLY